MFVVVFGVVVFKMGIIVVILLEELILVIVSVDLIVS